MSRSQIAVGVVALLLGGSCDGSTDPGDVGVPAELLIVGGDDQTAVVGRELADPLVVRVEDPNDRPVPGQAVNFVVTAGNGSVFAGTSLTSEAGEARERWILGTSTADSQRVEVRAVDNQTGAKLVSATFDAIALPDDPDSLVAVAGDEQEGTVGTPLPDSLAVRVLDRYGNPVPAVDVIWTTNAEGGQLNPDSSTTNDGGVAYTSWRLGSNAGKQTVSAKHNEIEQRFWATAIAGSIVRVEVTPETIHLDAIGMTRRLAATAFDRDGNKVANPSIDWSSSKGFVAGVNARGRLRARRNGTALITARAEGQVDTATAIVKQIAAKVTIATEIQDSLFPGDTLRLQVLAADSRDQAIPEPTIKWTSSDDAIVQVDSTGLVSALGRGAAKVVARVDQVSDSIGFTILRRDSMPPELEILAPRPLSVARPEIRIAATCRDDDPVGCDSLVVFAWAIGGSPKFKIAEGKEAIDTVASLPSRLKGRRVALIFEAYDPLNMKRNVREVYLEPSPALMAIDSVSGEVFDVGDDRILHLDSSSGYGVLKIYDRASGTDVVIMDDSTRRPESGFLTPVGVLFEARVGRIQVHEWRNGLLTEHGDFTPSTSLNVAGNYAAWNNFFALTRYDIGTGVETTVTTDAGAGHNDVAPNGDVVYWSSDGIFRYRAGQTTKLTSDDDGADSNRYPLTDGTNVVYIKSGPCCTNQTHRIAMYEEAGELILAGPRSSHPVPRRDYTVDGGWVAYTKPESGVLEVWVRSPTGGQQQVATFASDASGDSEIDSLSPSGDVVIVSGDRRYRWSPTTGAAPVDIGSRLGRSLWLGDELLVIIGNTVFRVQ